MEFGGNLCIPNYLFWLRVDYNLVQWLYAICSRKDETIGKVSLGLLPYIYHKLNKYFHTRKYSHHDVLDSVIYYQVWYFFRIFTIFYAVWLPGMAFIVIGAAENNKYANFICIGLIFCGIQPIVSTCMAMTKSNVRKYTRDLITLSYVRKASATSWNCPASMTTTNERDEEGRWKFNLNGAICLHNVTERKSVKSLNCMFKRI